jgi:hypothetical protein
MLGNGATRHRQRGVHLIKQLVTPAFDGLLIANDLELGASLRRQRITVRGVLTDQHPP